MGTGHNASSPEFDRFFYDGEIVELVNALDKDQIDLLECFDKSRLYCPECQKTRLKFTRKTSSRRAFLSTKPSSASEPNAHDKNCSHFFKPASRRQTVNHYEQLTDEQINDKLDAAINRFLRKAADKDHTGVLPCPDRNPALAPVTKNGRQTYRRLPSRSIYSINDITDEDLDIPTLFYGDVKLRVLEQPTKIPSGKPYYFLNIISSRTGKTIFPLYRAGNRDNVTPDVLYHVVFIGKVKMNEKGRIKPDLLNQKAIRIVEAKADVTYHL